MAERPSVPPPSSHEVAGEDFLYHLYRGSELLLEDKVHEAKSELENALALSPTDAKSQHLLGVVYFRLGLYPRAIAIYERLVRLHPGAVEPRVNLALSYLKTGQPALARVELERVVEIAPSHARAWGYLGLAFQGLGDAAKAREAFGRGGHEHMARRVTDPSAPGPALSIRPDGPTSMSHELRDAAVGAARLDAGEVSGRPETLEPLGAASGPVSWASLELGREPLPSLPSFRPSLLVSAQAADAAAASARVPASARPATPPPPPPSVAPAGPPGGRAALEPPAKPAELARALLLVFPRDVPVALHESGLVLVQAPERFTVRLGLVRSMTVPADATFTPLERRTRGRTLGEPFGGKHAPLYDIGGKCELVLSAPVGRALRPVALTDEPLTVREDLVAAFEPTVTYDNGRLPLGDGDASPMVLLRGAGTVVLALPTCAATVEVTDGHDLLVRGATVLGWLGRVAPRALAAAEAPASARGFVSLAGDGMVLVDVD
jgi:uncharacterized protein (AIM24 family)